jgi:hypothetical protein
MNDPEKKAIEADVIKLSKAGADRETILHFMRERGLGQADSLHILMRATHMDLGEARTLMIDSKTWADQRENNLRLQEELMEALFELSKEDDPNFKIIAESDTEEPRS